VKGYSSITEGSMAVAKAVKACRPDVISAYPISPQTHIVERLAEFVASGELNSQYLRVDSEFSAASVVYGASAAGSRTYTASASQGLALMTEVIFSMAGTRLPVVITAANRTLAAPISVQPDHQDAMTLRDSGIIQIYVENMQEAYDTHIQAFKIAEDKDILLPVMVCMDGWVLTHAYEPVEVFPDEEVQEFVGKYEPIQCLDPNNPITYGAYANEDKLMEYKYLMVEAQNNAKAKIEEIADLYKEKFNHYHGGLIEEYRTEDAEIILVAMGSLVSTIKVTVDEMRASGKKVGLIKVRSFRPFPKEAINIACKNAKVLAVLDKSYSVNIGGILATEVKSAFYNSDYRPLIQSFIAGIGGKEVNRDAIKRIVEDSEKVLINKKVEKETIFVNLDTQLI
jgi:pyruvate ferredoxin oxidoreductase alpha subunit